VLSDEAQSVVAVDWVPGTHALPGCQPAPSIPPAARDARPMPRAGHSPFVLHRNA